MQRDRQGHDQRHFANYHSFTHSPSGSQCGPVQFPPHVSSRGTHTSAEDDTGSIILEMLQTSALPLCASAPDCICIGEVREYVHIVRAEGLPR